VFHGPFCKTGDFLSSASHVLSFIHSRPHLSASDGSIVYSIRGSKVEAGPRFLSLNSLASLSTLFKHTTKSRLTQSTMSSVSTSLYGIHPHDDHGLHQNLMAQIDANPSMGSGEPFYPTLFDGVPAPFFQNPNNISATQSPHEEQLVVPAFLTNGVTNDAGLAPAFPTYNAVPHTFPYVTSSLFFSGLPTSPGSTLTPSRGPSRGSVPKRKRKSDDDYTKRIAMYLAKSKKVAPTRKPYGAGFRDMFVRSSPSYLILDNHERLLTKRNFRASSQNNRISFRSKSNVLSTRFIPDAVSPRPVRPTLRGKSTCSRNNTVSICRRNTWT
jgi:hypothetical protein